MGSMTENIADKAINDTRIVKQFTNPVKEPIDSDMMALGTRTVPKYSVTWSSIWPRA